MHSDEIFKSLIYSFILMTLCIKYIAESDSTKKNEKKRSNKTKIQKIPSINFTAFDVFVQIIHQAIFMMTIFFSTMW